MKSEGLNEIAHNDSFRRRLLRHFVPRNDDSKPRLLRLCLAMTILGFMMTFEGYANNGFRALNMPPDARSIGLSGAFTAIADDINAIYYNPAGLANIGNYQVLLSHLELFPDMSYNYLAGAMPTKYGFIGTSLAFFSVEPFPVYYYGVETGEQIGQNDFMLNLSYARDIYEGLLIGANTRFIRSSIAEILAYNIGFDIGLFYSFYLRDYLHRAAPEKNNWGVGLAFANLGPGSSYGDSENSDSLPALIRLGASYRFQNVAILSSEIEN